MALVIAELAALELAEIAAEADALILAGLNEQLGLMGTDVLFDASIEQAALEEEWMIDQALGVSSLATGLNTTIMYGLGGGGAPKTKGNPSGAAAPESADWARRNKKQTLLEFTFPVTEVSTGTTTYPKARPPPAESGLPVYSASLGVPVVSGPGTQHPNGYQEWVPDGKPWGRPDVPEVGTATENSNSPLTDDESMPKKRNGPKANPKKTPGPSRSPPGSRKPGTGSSLNVAQPAAKGVITRSGKPKMSNTAKGVIIQHREYLGDVISTGTGYTLLTNALLAPGSPGAFPWLSTLAERYEEFVFRRMALEYISEASTSTSGVVMVGFDRTAGRAGPTSKAAFLQDSDAIRIPPWQSTSMPVSCDMITRFCNPANKIAGTGITSTTLSTSNSDPKTIAIGNLFVAVSGVAAGTVGEIYITYEVELRNPVLVLPPSSWLAMEITSSSATAPFSAATTASTIFGNVPVSFNTAGNIMTVQLSGPVVFCLTAPTSPATASITVTSSNCTLTDTGSTIASNGFTSTYSITGVSGPTAVALTFASYTNLAISTLYPLKFRMAPYDRSLTTFTT